MDRFEDRIADHEVLFARTRRTRQLKLSSVELLVHHDRAGAKPSCCGLLPTNINSARERGSARILLADHRREPLETQPMSTGSSAT
jgi:hypothetical protein